MRILAVVHQFPPDFYSGTEILCLGTMQALARRGHQTAVITADPKRARSDDTKSDRIGEIPVTRIPTREPLRLTTAGLLNDEFEREQLTDCLLRQVEQFKPDIVHVHHVFGFGLPAIGALAKAVPTVVSATDFALVCPYAIALLPDGTPCAGPSADGENCVDHHLSRPAPDGTRQPRTRLAASQRFADLAAMVAGGTRSDVRNAVDARLRAARELAATASRILVASDHLQSFIAAAGLPHERIIRLPHTSPPVSVDIAPVRNPLRIGFLGTLARHKGAHVLIEAIKTLPDDLPLDVIIRGDFSRADQAYLHRCQQSVTGDKRIRIVDRVAFDRFGEALSEIDVLVVPSLWAENLPLVLLSGLEAGRYAVVSDVPGLTDALPDAASGCAVPAGDAAALAKLLGDLTRDPAPVLAARARDRQGSAFSKYIDALETLYGDVATPAQSAHGAAS